MKDCCIILNPEARTSRRLRVRERIGKVAPNATLHVTREPGEGEWLARQAAAQGFRTIVAGGGDGTVNEVLRGIAGLDARLGVLPLGTMNVFARELGIPRDWEAAWLRITGGGERQVDLVRANDQPVAQLAGVGFDARAIARVNPRVKRLLGPAAYFWAGLQQLASAQPRFRVLSEEYPPLEAVWVIVGTGRFYGGPIPVFPDAWNGDGFLKVIVVKNLTPATVLGGLVTLPFGVHTGLKGITYMRTKHLRVEALGLESDAPSLELDGELFGAVPVVFRIEPQAIRVAV